MITLVKNNIAIISYIFWGGLTTLVSLGSYSALIYFLNTPYQVSNIASWVLSVTFAFFANKYFVFRSRDSSIRKMLSEAGGFYGARVGTLVMEIVILWFGISVLSGDEFIWKFLVQIVILVANYVASKLIFKKA